MLDHMMACSSVGKEFACSARDLGSILGSGRSPGEGNGNPLQYSCLENLMDRGAWWELKSMGSQRVGHDRTTEHTHRSVKWKLKWKIKMTEDMERIV